MIIRCIPSGLLGANTYIAADEETKKAFILDPGGHNSNTVNYIQTEGFELEYIILTHGHGDHIGGVTEYQRLYPAAKLVACIHEKEVLADPGINLSRECGNPSLSLTADIWVNDGDTLKVGNSELKFIHTPGHTPGGICILTGNILFSGDTLFCQSIGRTDFPGGSFSQIVTSIKEKLFVLPGSTKVYPGHMGPTTIDFEKRHNPFV